MSVIDEFSTGDLSSNNCHPSFIKVKKKKNKHKIKIKARVYNDLGDDDTLDTRDIFAFKVPKSKEFKSAKLNKCDNNSYGKNKGGGGWIGVAKGDCITDLNDPTGLIGGHLIGVAEERQQVTIFWMNWNRNLVSAKRPFLPSLPARSAAENSLSGFRRATSTHRMRPLLITR